MISNPAANPLFWPTAQIICAILASGLVLLLAVERQHLAELHRRTLFQRWAVWAAIALVYSLAVLSGPIGMLFLVGLIVFQSLREYCELVGLPPLYRTVLLAMGLSMGPLAVWAPEAFFGVLPLLLILATLQPLLTQDVRTGMTRLAFAALGFGYLPLLLWHLVLIETSVPGGPGLLLALALAVALSDVGAFTVGKLFGRHKLTPLVSPNKTWEGVAGNLLGAFVGTILTSFALPPARAWLLLVVLPVVVAAGAVWGDLVESLLKREFGTKDAGAWLPGFGGLLDRVDSLIVVAPLTYYLLRALP